MSQSSRQNRESLVTRKSIALALSPPRAPPHDSAHRKLLLGQDPSEAALAHHHSHSESDYHHNIRRHAMILLRRHHFTSLRLPHPHLPAGPEIGDQVTRALGVILPLSWQNRCRDSGGFRFVCDWLVTFSVPALALTNPSATLQFLKLTKACTRIRYGEHRMQVMDVFFPEDGGCEKEKVRGLVFFVHGGAWGSGLPWLYRLSALPFLEMNLAVAVVGYRTYPDADADGQVDDLERAASELASRHPTLCKRSRSESGNLWNNIGTCLMGHSSGAHIALLMLAHRVNKKLRTTSSTSKSREQSMEFDSFVGLSGPYDISHHFDYEAGRGVEELSPMKPVCGYSREEFQRNSPALRLRRTLATVVESDTQCLNKYLPPMLLVHGVEDAVVPFTATADAARILRSCGASLDEVYLAQTGHQDVVMHIMLGGRARDTVVGWLTSQTRGSLTLPQIDMIASSKL